jgi:DNA polymerase-3 subunit delta
MDRPPPIVYLLYGDDDLAFRESINKLRVKLGDPTTADMNTQHFTSVNLNLSRLIETCTSIPFLARRRLIILDHADRLPADETWKDRFLQFLEMLTDSTALIIVEHVDVHSAGKEEKYHRSSFLYQWAIANPQKSYIRRCVTPRGPAFIAWIHQRCQSLGGEIDPSAAHLLAELVAEDPYIADQEIVKLLDYIDLRRTIEIKDVELLTPFRGQGDVFAMVDAIGHRNGKQAQQRLHLLLEGEDLRYVFAMIVRQFRLLLQAREALDEGKNPSQVISVPPFVADKISKQARNFTLEDLEKIHHQLLTIDFEAKTSQVDKEVALDSLISTLAD